MELLELMRKRLGPCEALVVQEAAGRMPVSVYVSPATSARPTHVLFTLGLSLVPMRVPEGKEAFRYAELMLDLPADWPLAAEMLATPEFGWPIQWLLTLARYPYEQKTWLGAPVTIIENGNPPQPLAPNARFTAMLLLTRGTDDVAQEDGTTVKLYKLIPLYPEECQVEKEEGLTALFTAFDQSESFSDVIDVNRPSVVTPG